MTILQRHCDCVVVPPGCVFGRNGASSLPGDGYLRRLWLASSSEGLVARLEDDERAKPRHHLDPICNGRQLAAWLGLVPRQHSSGGKPILLGVSKRGDCYLRTLLVHGARSVIVLARKRSDDKGSWLKRLLERRHVNVAAIALANETVRTVWAMLAHDREYCPNYRSVPSAA